MDKNITRTLELRASVLSGIRSFFSSRGYTEADVPLLTPGVIPEASIELFRTEKLDPYGNSRNLYLLPSPEYYLKKLIAAGSGDIFSLSHSFRNSEQSGRWHNPEFTMLEWYKMDAGYMDSIQIAEDFTGYMVENTADITVDIRSALRPPFERISMNEAFSRWTGFDLSDHCTGRLSSGEEISQLQNLATGMGLSAAAESDSWEELFNLVFVHRVEPNLPTDKPVVIFDYPAGIPALAKPAAAPGRLERWELYVKGIELANCYSEETDYNTVKRFFNREALEKKKALVDVNADMNWCGMYKTSYPRCSGTALGVDRLMMLLSGSKSIEGVILFPDSDILADL